MDNELEDSQNLSSLLWFDPILIAGNIGSGGIRGRIPSAFRGYLSKELEQRHCLGNLDFIDDVVKASIIFPSTKEFQKFKDKQNGINAQVDMYAYFIDQICTRMRNVVNSDELAALYVENRAELRIYVRKEIKKLRAKLEKSNESSNFIKSCYSKAKIEFDTPKDLFSELEQSIRVAALKLGCMDASTNLETTELPIFVSYAIDRNFDIGHTVKSSLSELMRVMKIKTLDDYTTDRLEVALVTAVEAWKYDTPN